MLKEPIEVVYSALEEPIGQPQDIAANLKANGSVNFDLETPIPQNMSTASKTNAKSAVLADQMANETAPAVTPFLEEVSQKSDG